MRMCKKRVLSFLLTLALVVGCFAGTGIAVEAVDFPDVQFVTILPSSLGSEGGKVEVTATGENLGDNVWYTVLKKEDGVFKAVGEELNTAQTSSDKSAKFEMTLPGNDKTEQETYYIHVVPEEPGNNSNISYGTTYQWANTSNGKVIVAAAGENQPTEIDKTTLKSAIDNAKKQYESSYTQASYAAMQSKLSEAETIYESNEATQEQVLNITNELNEAIKNLKFLEISGVTVSLEELTSNGGNVVVTVTGVMEEKIWYQLQVKDEYWTEAGDVGSVAITNESEVEFDVTIPKNTSAVEKEYRIVVKQKEYSYNWATPKAYVKVAAASGSEIVVDKSKLEKAISDAEDISRSTYTTVSWEAMQTKLSNAKKINDALDVTQQQVDDAVAELQDAISELTYINISAISTNLNELSSEGGIVEVTISGAMENEIYYQLQRKVNDLYEGAEEIKIINITDGSKVIFNVEIPKNETTESIEYRIVAKTFENSPWASEKAIIVVAPNKGSKVGLQKIIDDAKSRKESDYKADGKWAVVQEKLKNAEAVNKDENSTEKQIEVAATELQKALDELVKKIPGIYTATATPESLKSNGGKVTISLTGEDLLDKVWYVLRKQREDGSYEVIGENKEEAVIEGGAESNFEVTIPANAESRAVTYQLKVKETDPVETWADPTGWNWMNAKVITITVEANSTSEKVDKTTLQKAIADAESRNESDYVADGKWAEMLDKLAAAKKVYDKEDASAVEVKTATDELQAALNALVPETVAITEVTAAPTHIPATGDTVQLSVKGTNLTKTNWGIDVQRFISGTNQQQSTSDKAGEATVKEITENGATIEISANGMKNDVDFVFSVGPKNGNTITKQKSVIVVQAAKDYSATQPGAVVPESVVLADESTVAATFKTDISAREGVDLKKLIYVANADGSNRRDLTADDNVTVDNNMVIVKYAEPLQDVGATTKLYIKEGALTTTKDGEELVVASIEWLIQTTPRISGITVDKDVFDNKGGTVTATLNGYKVETIKLETIDASVYLPGETSASDIKVEKDANDEGKPILTFTVPANTTKNTVSYWLNVKHNGTPVYESAADSRGHRTTISVLPEGKTDKDVTLSKVTISGNNKIDEDANNTTDIAVDVVNNIGELKTELRVYGTNLDSSLTKVRAIDENGIVWPVYQISECDGTWRFIAIAGEHRNGVFGDGNSQLIELLPPRYAGTNKTYKIQVALDGKNFIEEPCVTLKVNNEGISGEPDFRDCTANNFKYVTVNYVDEKGNAIAPKDVYKGYCISMPEGFGIAPKQISGYQLIKEPKLDEWVNDGRTYNYVYRSLSATNNIKVSSIKLSAVSKKIAAGKKVQLTTTVSPANATNKTVTYKSSNTKYATVNASGKVTVKKAGAGKTVTITATAADGSGKSASYKIKIMKNAVKSVKVKASKTVKAGKKVKAKATVKTTGKKVNKTLKWTSSNTKYATVTSKGVIKTKKAGKGKTVKITATATDGSNKKSTVKIKIK